MSSSAAHGAYATYPPTPQRSGLVQVKDPLLTTSGRQRIDAMVWKRPKESGAKEETTRFGARPIAAQRRE